MIVRCTVCNFKWPDCASDPYIADNDTSGAYIPMPNCPNCGSDEVIIVRIELVLIDDDQFVL